ncbi:MAG TPA: hypothetical protein VKU82_15100 [Planctomycetaceae bacterium]|nr:hypothetical protein [Planctomycetaceae bacterium]
MTRSLFTSIFVALSLTALAAAPVSADSWFKFSSWGKKKNQAAGSDVIVASSSQYADDDGDDGDDPCQCDMCRRGLWNKCRFKLRRAQMGYGSMGTSRSMPMPMPVGCYPSLNSSLYPCPRPDVPAEVGTTIITNAAFYPHEMLHAHRYRALYPPYYYEAKCGLTCIPFFPKPCLKGTLVTVKYHTCLPCGYSPPSCSTKCCFSNTQFK